MDGDGGSESKASDQRELIVALKKIKGISKPKVVPPAPAKESTAAEWENQANAEVSDADLRKEEETRKEVAGPVASVPVGEVPVLEPGQKAFDCPAGHVVAGPVDQGTAFCPTCKVKINPRR